MPDMIPPPVPDLKPMSEPSRIAGVFFNPKQTFADVLERPRWYIPVIILSILSFIFVTLYGQRFGWEQVVRQQMEQSGRAQTMTPEQLDQAITMGAKFGSIIGYVQSLIGPLVAVLIIAGVLMFVANSILGTKIRFPQMAGIVSYASLTGLITVPLMILVMFLKNKEDYDIRNPLAFNLGAFLGPDSAKWLKALLSSFDLFTFWTMSLIAIGIMVAGRKLTFGKALSAVVIPWLVWVLIKVAASSVFG